MKATKQTSPTTMTTDLRQALKAMLQRELENLPTLLESLEPKERIAILCRIMPFILPKVMPVPQTEGEPFSVDW